MIKSNLIRAIAFAGFSATLVTIGGCANHPPQTHSKTPAPRAQTHPPKPVPKPPVILKVSTTTKYVVKKGDTLWGIAQHFLKDPWAWPEVWYANPQIKNPHWIFPGDVLTLYYVNGKPRITVTGGPRVEKTIVLKPHVIYQKLPESEHPIPIQTIRPFLIKTRVVTKDALKNAPHIIGAASNQILFASGMKVYVRGLQKHTGTAMYSVYRKGKALRSPVTGKILAYQATYLGNIRIIKPGKIATGILTKTNQSIVPGDRLLSYIKTPVNYTFLPRAPKKTIHGQVISLFNALAMVGQYQVVVIDLGKKNDLHVGDVVRLEKVGRLINDHFATTGEKKEIQLPNTNEGMAMIFKTYQNISYALILSATRPIEVGDIATNP